MRITEVRKLLNKYVLIYRDVFELAECRLRGEYRAERVRSERWPRQDAGAEEPDVINELFHCLLGDV